MEPTLSPEEKEIMESGIDIFMIDDNLSLSYEERLIQHQQALDLVLVLQKAPVIDDPELEQAP